MKKLAALLMLILWSVSMTASASASMTVLCVEKSGKAAFEYSVGAHCDDATGALATRTQSANASVHCADCVDSPLASTSSASTRLSDEAAFVQISTYVTALLDTTHDYELVRSRGSEVSAESAAMRSTYIGQRETIVIQQ
jgi:pyruvate/oxaloacetate carboxyltransferase